MMKDGDDMVTIALPSANDTVALGRRLGQCATSGLVIALYGGLGAGKTTFAQGLAKGLGVASEVQSPTFTLVVHYDDGRLPFYHLDVYRLGDEAILEAAMFEEFFYGDGVCAIEWAQLLDAVLPEDRLDVRFANEGSRRVTIEALGPIAQDVFVQWVKS